MPWTWSRVCTKYRAHLSTYVVYFYFKLLSPGLECLITLYDRLARPSSLFFALLPSPSVPLYPITTIHHFSSTFSCVPMSWPSLEFTPATFPFSAIRALTLGGRTKCPSFRFQKSTRTLAVFSGRSSWMKWPASGKTWSWYLPAF